DHMEAIREIGGQANILWQVGFNPGGGSVCETSTDGKGIQLGHPISSSTDAIRWKDIALNVLRHLNDGTKWDPKGKKYNVKFVEFMDDPYERLGYQEGSSLDELFEAYLNFASAVKAWWPDDVAPDDPDDTTPVIHVGGISYTLSDVSDLEFARSADKHPLLQFIDFCEYHDTPLDFVSFRTRTEHPHEAACIAGRLRAYLDDVGLTRTKLLVAGVEADVTGSKFNQIDALSDDLYRSTYLGAFHAATRIFLQSPLDGAVCKYADDAGPASWMIAGRVPRVFSDLKAHSGEDMVAIESLIVDSPFVEADGTAKPAFMSLFPFRQIANGHEMVSVTKGNDTQGMAVLASHESSSGRVLHVIIANANIQDGNADITYDLNLEKFVSTAKEVDYKLAVLDRGAVGHQSFHFSETGVIETGTGTMRFVHQMAVPSVHYIQFHKPE
ncbi:MAG: hypothetical protein QF464_09400, partial [Myxococcota bacterium]|nr:hypothetical protein [Myxococcota bacterium]